MNGTDLAHYDTMKVKEELKKYSEVKGIPYFVVGDENSLLFFFSKFGFCLISQIDPSLLIIWFFSQINGKEEFAGAQPTEVFLAAFEAATK